MPHSLDLDAHAENLTTGDQDLHDQLSAIRPRIAFPPTPDLASAVGRAIVATPRASTLRPRPGRSATSAPGRWWWRAAAIAAAVCLLVVAGSIIPVTSETVADWFGVPGIQIIFEVGEETPAVPPDSATNDVSTPTTSLGLLLGEPVSLEQARARVDFMVAMPNLPAFGPPDEIYLRDRPGSDQVSFLYHPRPGLREVAGTGIGLLLVQFEADDEALWGVKKMVDGRTETRVVPLGELEALWLGGAHRLLVASDPLDGASALPVSGTPDSRLTGNVLLWAENGVTYRVESALTLAETIQIAEWTRGSIGESRETPVT